MIQVCSQCGTRWNVRERQRSWCPRCGGGLLAPSAPESQWASPPRQPQQPQRPPARLAPGYRWIAVRPGAPPPSRPRRRPLGPTPRYLTVPRWGLHQDFAVAEERQQAQRTGPAAHTVRLVIVLAMIALAGAAFAHIVRYILLLVNRTVLLHPVIAWGGVLLGMLASLLVLAIMTITVVMLISWLVARRREAYSQRGQEDPRSPLELWICALAPVVNLFMAPVFVLELARADNRMTLLRRPIAVWWIVWVLSAIVATWSIVSTVYVTFFNNTPQNIADNTVTVIIGYLLGLTTLLLTYRVFQGFEATEAQGRSVRRWVVVAEGAKPPAGPGGPHGSGPAGRSTEEADESTDTADTPAEGDTEPADEQPQRPESSVPVEPAGQNPAA
ncbi:DUF4328 domain-containing protein [Mycolicibacterium smegmatis]|uniref:DUF4328 domain-containing protein n=4 Tax=Mycolicibacterium smegmatis TaxID=1772 RepID=I7GAT1_MYCS2|nr:DUF4328 domain-containing protein [Mycolicibacterium smegmatis]ABK71262.1 probable conserved transmembrane protein [Mycolicibacterium smegmatis MC2 155]AFP42682.1 hypothetical protein MSMEI_6256 [Mycolicibacterium smegmatis MC2 155]AIU11404.1 membrane protein [Mycolicibacterium smegmatis MC2 155]AIU18028.1 membrane protein [Mycolicibacterium smegmatis]AIU24652.1 membrane protein [Mycolicibacterium smegmatis]